MDELSASYVFICLIVWIHRNIGAHDKISGHMTRFLGIANMGRVAGLLVLLCMNGFVLTLILVKFFLVILPLG